MPDPSDVRDALAEAIANRIYELDFDTLELRNWGEESVADPYRVVAEAAVDAVASLPGAEIVWFCEAWEQGAGVSEPCVSGSTDDAPDFDCHWQLIVRLPDTEPEEEHV